MKKPIILITGGPAYDRQFHTESFIVNKPYTSAIIAAGGIPVMPLDMDSVDDYVAMADGCVCTGTHSFSPDPALPFNELQAKRIEEECKLMQAFLKAKKPLLGICQGMQQLNVACGGDLHIDFRLEDGIEHNKTEHTLETVEGSWVNRLFGTGFIVNSFHNVKVKNLAPDLKVTALSPDGVIEAYEHKTLPAFGFQWHPERMRGDFNDTPYGPNTDVLFNEFVKMCIK